ncbi:MAG: efflux RND transporter permease subunit [Bacteroidales bacterium]|nr:efflux RND transporter permease subunit [Bacteroidales bacterium]MCM1146351.1 efflux RND transporter permease subunit [Bacteroidales bacterium]MCM1205211.1 efflux RND transporter permease subunit [Bacillota bacterium]MCM1509704.1 efflux RND transporter permease subunit [Clostridium sp.]
MTVKTFIDRPILSGVISVAVVIIGLIGLSQLAMEQFPDIAPPTVRVSATYTGANAETVMKSVIVPLEEQLNGVENMMYMTSTATNTGSASVSVYFKQGTDADMAVVNVQNRVASAQGLLPAEVTKSGVTVRKRQNSQLKAISLYSPDDSYDANFLTNYMKINIEPQMSRIAGVGEVNIWGASYSMRIWLDPQRMAQYGLMPSDITAVLAEQNVESPTGTLGSESDNTFQYVLKYRGRYEDEEDYGNMVVKSLPDGDVLRLKDVARIELGAENYAMQSGTNGHPGANCMMSQTSGSNANEIITEIDRVMENMQSSLPKGMVLTDITSTKDFLDASIANVVETLVIAIILVVLVVYVFLHDLRATLIPSLAIIVSLVGTFAFIYAVGFSLNLLTLFALVLVIGTVVDDSIVVVEAVQAKFDEGYTSPYDATVDAMRGLTSALMTTTVVFMAVFIPVSFMGGTTGVFYTQFGLTMAVAVAVSLLNAMTLSPALCALIMKPRKAAGDKPGFSDRFHYAFDSSFRHMQQKYMKGVSFLLRRKWIAVGSIAMAVVFLAILLNTTKTGLVPQEDMGSVNVNVQTAPGSNLAETARVMDEIEAAIQGIPQIRIYSRVTGKDAQNNQSASAGSFTIRLKNWEERKDKGDDINSVMNEIYRRTAGIKAASIRLSTRPMISGYGMSNGFDLYVQDKKGGTVDDLLKHTNEFIDALNKRPEISRAYTTFATKYPQYMVEVDAALCKRNGVSPSDVLSTLSDYVGGSYSSNLNRFTKLYRVMVQASPEYRLDTEALNNIFVRNSSGEMTPISQYLTLTRVYGSESLSRFNLFTAISVSGTPADGYSSGQAIEAIKEVAETALPEGYGYEFGGMSREEASTENTTTMVFIICIVFIYLILCALYESLMIPFAVILSVPFGLLGSFIFAKLWGLENNIYMQIGLIMLIGLLAKTAILLTEYASDRRRQGMSITTAAMSAAKARLRPILMTSLTMIFGMIPLMSSKGVGANGNISVGVGTVGGMLLGTVGLLFVVPSLFIVFQYLQEGFLPGRKRA